jgi:DNA-binding transcriptional LysR family regulator
MLALEADIRNRISRRNEVVGTLHLAMGELSAATWFPRFLKRVAAAHPDLVVEPTVSQARSMELNVERGELDCAIIAGVPTRATLAAQSLGSIRFAWMAAPSLVDGFKTPPGLAELLTRHPLIAPNSLSGQLQGFADWMTAAGVAMNRVIRCNSLNAIVELTCAGAGVSLLPRQYLMPIINRGLMVEISGGATEPTLQYSFIWRRDDLRVLTARARDLVSEEVDFDIPSQLWQIGAASSTDESLLAIH